MHIYNTFVSHSQLISPMNEYSCKRITKQNIKQFGFSSIEDLHKSFPDFPLVCDEFLLKLRNCNTSPKKIKHIEDTKQQNKIKREQIEIEERSLYTVNPKLCKKCGSNIDFEKRTWSYCSRKCANSRTWTEEDNKKKSIATLKHGNKTQKENFLKSLVTKKCYNCNSSVKVSPILVREDDYYSCYANECKEKVTKLRRKSAGSKGGKVSAANRVKRSKQEIKLFNLLSKHFTNISHNEPIANGWDADILLHDFKIAILWNGPWHYKDMGLSNHSLSQVVNRDCIKIQEFENIGWEVKIYQDNQWTPEEAMIDILVTVRHLL